MEEVLMNISKKGIKPIFEDLQAQPRVMMEKIDIIPDLVPKEMIFNDFNSALKYIKGNVENVV